MAKIKTVFYCKECGNESPKWIGHCPGCGAWNSYVEESVALGKDNKSAKNSILPEMKSKPVPVLEINAAKETRIDMGCGELNRVLGGGLVPGSLILLSGEPGIGKSTLLLQVALNLKDKKVLYVSGEESAQQIKMRAERIGVRNES
jgi:DNA repair protein RadA/Sms